MRIWCMLILAMFLASCGEKHVPPDRTQQASNKPYRVNGQWYYPLLSAKGYDETGIASWYGRDFHGRKTSNGETYDMHAISAAHPTLPMGTIVRITNLENGKTLDVRINDRGPFVKDRLIDLSFAAAKRLGFAKKGTARVRVQALEDNGSKVLHYAKIVPSPRKNTETEHASGTLSPIRHLPEVIRVAHADEVGDSDAATQKKTKASPPTAPLVQNAETSKPYFVQIGAFVSRESAETLRQRYAERYPLLRLFVDDSQRPVVYKVRQGPFSRRERAEVLAGRMEMDGIANVSLVSDNARPLIATPDSSASAEEMPKPLVSPAMNRDFVTHEAPATSGRAFTSTASPNMANDPSISQSALYVQIGAFSSRQGADRLLERYRSHYPSIQIHPPGPEDARQLYRVRIGPFHDDKEATRLVEELEASGIEKPIIVNHR